MFSPGIEIFGPDTCGDFEPHFHDIDLCQIQYVVSAPGEPYEQDGYGCAAVTLNRELGDDPTGAFRPVFRWLDSGTPDEGGPPMLVTLRDAEDPDNTFEYRAPACAAIYDPGYQIIDKTPFEDGIELVVCYQYRDLSSLDPIWQIGVTAVQWRDSDVNDFYYKEPTERIDYELPIWDNDRGEFNPDIAYNCHNGDCYCVYSELQEDQNCCYIKYRRYDRATNKILPGEWRLQNTDHNGHDPSVDVGLVQVGTELWHAVAVTYTSQFHQGHLGYHICGIGWQTSEGDHDRQTNFPIINPNFSTLAAGLSCVDVSPYCNPTNFATCTYTQVTGSDGFGATTGVFVVNFFGTMADLDDHFPVETGGVNIADGMYSSIAIHDQVTESAPIWASVSYMGQEPESDILHPRATRIRLDDPAHTILWNDYIDIDSIIVGNYNISDIPFENPGVSSAININADNTYWAAWADRIEMEPPPEVITAAWGDTII